MAEINRMFLPSTVRSRVISPLRSYQKKGVISDSRNGISPERANLELPASMKRKGIRGRTINNRILAKTHEDLVRVDDNTKYKTIDVGASFKNE